MNTFKAIGAVCVVILTLATAGCGSGAKPAGPDVRGMALPDAESTLESASIGYSVKADDGLFGVLIPDNWLVCSEGAVNAQMVTLHVKKYGC